jgi:polyferredoxin
MEETKKKTTNILIIKILAVLLIALALIIGTGFGMSRQMDKQIQDFFRLAYEVFENVIRAVIIILGAFFTVRYTLQKKDKISRFRLINLTSFSLMAFIVLILIPLTTNFWRIYEALMPFPWTTLPLRSLSLIIYYEPRYQGVQYMYGMLDNSILISAFLGYQFVTFIGTLFLGRRWHCSMICLYNGCHAETLGFALPLIPQNKQKPDSKQIRPSLKKILRGMQLPMFVLNMLLILFWGLLVFFAIVVVPVLFLIIVEILIKFLILELLLMIYLWIFVSGRGYCYYCPAGFFLGLIGKVAGQKIETNLTKCIKCNACNDSCQMSIDIAAAAKKNIPVNSINCTGCGLCVDNCPTQNLKYSTYLVK